MRPEIILGPPGTGKTTRLLSMVDDELTAGTSPEHIGYVSFTKRAATEARDRACEKFGMDKRAFRWFRTLHSLCHGGLNLSAGDVLQGKKLSEFGQHAGIAVSEYVTMDEGQSFGFEPGDRLLFMENLSRVRQIPLREQYEEDHDGFSWEQVEWFREQLLDYKQTKHLIDYTDMLEMFVRQGWRPPLEVLFVDEAQDLSILQWRVVDELAKTCRRVVIAGDDDQAIYRWAGAAVEHFVSMDGDVSVLDKSWRVPRSVQTVADGIIDRVGNRRQKDWSPREDEGSVDYVTDFANADIREGESTLVLARNAYVVRGVEKYIRQQGLMYESSRGPSIPDSAARAAVGWERLRAGRSIPVETARKVYEYMSSVKAVARGYKQLPQFLDDNVVTMEDLRLRGGLLLGDMVWYDALDRMQDSLKLYMRHVLRSGNRLSQAPEVRLSTIHGSKGGEADHVVLLCDMAQRTFSEYQKSPDDEARVWYVAVTRARQRLTIVRPKTERNFSV